MLDLGYSEESALYLGVSVLYVYTHLDLPSPCSGDIHTVRLCYVLRGQSTGTNITAATLLILQSLTIRATLPFTVSTSECEEAGLPPIRQGELSCCVSRELPASLGLRARQASPLDFRFALQTPPSLDVLGLRGQRDSTVQGFRLDPGPLGELRVGDVIPSEDNILNITMPLITFLVQGMPSFHSLLLSIHSPLASLPPLPPSLPPFP